MSYPLSMLNYAGDYATLAVGDTLRTNHTECGDTRRRLYFTRKNGVVLGFCHNCNAKGVESSSYYVTAGFSSSYVTPVSAIKTLDVFEVPEDYDESWAPIEYQKAAQMLYDPNDCRWIIPVWDTINIATANTAGSYYGYNSRAAFKYQEPKYLLSVDNEFSGYMCYYNEASVMPNSMVFVEDQMSAVAVAMHSPRTLGVCMFGAKNSIEKLHAMVKRFACEDMRYTVWLDNDNETVNETSRVMSQYLRLLGKTKVHRSTVYIDPKKVAPETIRAECENG
jgi:hypothetical protein